MSVKVMHLVWQNATELSGNDLLVMLALADWSDDKGVCWPSVPSLGKKARVSDRTVRYVLDRLEAGNYLNRIEQRGRTHSNQYLLNLQVLGGENMQQLQVIDPVKPANDDIKPASSDIKPAIAIAAKPLIEPLIKPSRERDARASCETSIPEGFAPTDEMVAKAKAKYPHLDVLAASEDWLGSMRANTHKYRYTNWSQAWWNGMARANREGWNVIGGNGNGKAYGQNGADQGGGRGSVAIPKSASPGSSLRR